MIVHLPSVSLEIRNGAAQQTVETVLLALRCLCISKDMSIPMGTLDTINFRGSPGVAAGRICEGSL